MNIFKKWKQEWFDREESKLCAEFEKELNELKDNLANALEDQEAKLISATNTFEMKQRDLIFSQREVDELNRRCELKKLELERLNSELLQQIRLMEAKGSPEGIWAQAFTAGFNKGFDMAYLQHEGFDRVKKLIRDEAINETLGKRNGHH
jgi:hypothetical protein